MKRLFPFAFCLFFLSFTISSQVNATVGAACNAQTLCSGEAKSPKTEYCSDLTQKCVATQDNDSNCSDPKMCKSGYCDGLCKPAPAGGSVAPVAGAGTPAGTASATPGTAAVSPAAPGGGAAAAPSVPSITIPNFLGITDPNDLIARIIKIIIGLSGTLALIMFIYGGITFMISGGQQKQIKAGANAMIYSAGGLILIFASYIIVNQLLSILIRK